MAARGGPAGHRDGDGGPLTRFEDIVVLEDPLKHYELKQW